MKVSEKKESEDKVVYMDKRSLDIGSAFARQETTYDHSDNMKFSNFDEKRHYIERLFIVFDKPEVFPAMTGCLKYFHSIQYTRIDRKACRNYVFKCF